MATKVKAKENKQTMSTNNYILLAVVITTLVVIICGFIGKSLAGQLVLNTKVISAKLKAQSDLDTKLENAPKLIEAYNNLGANKQLIENSLPNKSDFAQIVSIAENMGNDAGLKLKSLTPSDEAAIAAVAGATGTSSAPDPAAGPKKSSTTPSPQAYQFQVTVEGPYPQVVAFAKNIERSSRPMQVKSIVMQGTGNSIKADFKINTYYQAKAEIKDRLEPVK